jgi:hypothetical protein
MPYDIKLYFAFDYDYDRWVGRNPITMEVKYSVVDDTQETGRVTIMDENDPDREMRSWSSIARAFAYCQLDYQEKLEQGEPVGEFNASV